MLVSGPDEVTAGASRNYVVTYGCESSPERRVNILVVDDNKLIADTTCAILDLFGFCAIPAYDAITALRLATETSPDILLSDIMMPVVNGVDLAITVRRILPDTAVLLFSSYPATEDILEDAQRAGHFFEILTKPIRPEELVYRLNRVHWNSRFHN